MRKLYKFMLSILILNQTLLSSSFLDIESLTNTERAALIIQARCDYAKEKIQQGNLAMIQQDYIAASKHYYNALESIKQDKPVFAELQKKTAHLLCEAITLAATEDSLTSTSPESKRANCLINKVATQSYPPHCTELITLSNKFKNNQFYAPPIHAKIKDYLRNAEINYTQEAWENALSDYKKVLSLEKSNTTALLGIELIHEKEKKDVTMAQKDRKAMLSDLDKEWKLPSNETNTTNPSSFSHNQSEEYLAKKLNSLIIPQIDFYYIPVTEALKELKRQACLADDSEENPNKKGINIVLKLSPNKDNNPEPNVHLSLTKIPLGEAIRYLAQQANLTIKVDPYAVSLSSIDEEDELKEPLLTQEYKVPPDFFNISPDSQKEKSDLIQTTNSFPSEKEALISQGITFPKGASAYYFSDNNILVVRNTSSNLNLIDLLIRNATEHPPIQVEIEARFLEVKQNFWQEKGLNWLLGTFPIGKKANGGGGTAGNQASYQSQDYPIQQNGSPVGTIAGGPPGAGSVTAGNRQGSSAVTASMLETLLGGYFAPNAGVLALAGVLTNPQFQVVLRALNQKKGVDLLSSPKVTVSSGKKAIITIARDFPYPSEYLPPQVPQNQSGGINPAIPATPASFKRRNVGVELEVQPIVDPDQKKINLQLAPQIVEFQGFVNYGNPIFSQAPSFIGIGQGIATGSTTPVLLTENTINQPIFSVRQVNTQVALRSGQTIVLGGLMREDVQKINDKTPIIGDLPLVGKLFRSSSEQHIKKNLLIFVTVWLVDSSGKKFEKKNNTL